MDRVPDGISAIFGCATPRPGSDTPPGGGVVKEPRGIVRRPWIHTDRPAILTPAACERHEQPFSNGLTYFDDSAYLTVGELYIEATAMALGKV